MNAAAQTRSGTRSRQEGVRDDRAEYAPIPRGNVRVNASIEESSFVMRAPISARRGFSNSQRMRRGFSSSLRLRRGFSNSRRLRRGFSMVEMLGVIVVMGLIAMLVSMNWRAILPRSELHSAVRTIASTLQGVRSDAIARNQVFQVQYDIEKNRYRVITPFKQGGGLAASNEDRIALAWTDLPASVAFRTITVDGVEYQKGMVFVRFDALGTASGHTILLVQTPYETLYTIEVQGLLGLIDYHEGLFTRALPKESDFK